MNKFILQKFKENDVTYQQNHQQTHQTNGTFIDDVILVLCCEGFVLLLVKNCVRHA